MPNVLTSADKYARAIEAALVAWDPLLNVPGGITKLMAEFAEPYREFMWGLIRSDDDIATAWRVCCGVAVRFGVGPGRMFFNISEDGMTATRNSRSCYSI